MPASYRKVAQIMGVFGLKGVLKVKPMTDFLERFAPGALLMLDGVELTVEDSFVRSNRLYLKLDGVDTVDQARAVVFHYLEGDASYEPELDEGEYLTADLVGLRVMTTSGEELGIVNNVFGTPAHDVIVVGEIMIPAVKEFVRAVDLDRGLMKVELIEGMRAGGK